MAWTQRKEIVRGAKHAVENQERVSGELEGMLSLYQDREHENRDFIRTCLEYSLLLHDMLTKLSEGL